jgi:hypothetical protein
MPGEGQVQLIDDSPLPESHLEEQSNNEASSSLATTQATPIQVPPMHAHLAQLQGDPLPSPLPSRSQSVIPLIKQAEPPTQPSPTPISRSPSARPLQERDLTGWSATLIAGSEPPS